MPEFTRAKVTCPEHGAEIVPLQSLRATECTYQYPKPHTVRWLLFACNTSKLPVIKECDENEYIHMLVNDVPARHIRLDLPPQKSTVLNPYTSVEQLFEIEQLPETADVDHSGYYLA